MNIIALKHAATKLDALLHQYAVSEPDAAVVRQSLSSLLTQISSATTFAPLKGAAPCGHYFHEGSLRAYPELERAYSQFSMYAQGQDPEHVKTLLAAALKGAQNA